ncbi:MAG: amidohydrolase family protein [Firmicutes bacterium]|nr:amidohydrolase family protein [Bacillota bacterium]
MGKLLKKTLSVLLALAVVVTFTPMIGGIATADAATKLSAPASFSGTASSDKAIKLSWSKSAGASKYIVYKNGKKLKTISSASLTDKDVKKGKTYKYYVKAKKGKQTSKATWTIKVKAAKNGNVSSLSVADNSKKLAAGSTAALKAKLTPSKSIVSKSVTWSSSNSKVAAVKNGKLTAKTAGTAKITARAHNGKTSAYKITVVKAAASIYTNGKIYTVEGKDWDKKPQKAMAVSSDGSILATGTDAAIKVYANNKTKAVDLKGKSVYPGFVDSHVHPPGTAMTELFEIDCYGLMKAADTLTCIRDFVTEHPDEAIYWGNGFNMGMVDETGNPPTKEWLDEICPDKPMILTSYDGHSLWLNSVALKACNITSESKAPAGGRIQLGADGEPNGILTDASSLVTLTHTYSDEQYREGMALFMESMNGWGYTACSTGGNGALKQAVDMDREGKITMHINYSSAFDPEDVDGSIAQLEEFAQYAKGAKNVKVGAMKFFTDGVVEGSTAYLLEPYTEGAGMGSNWTSAPKVDADTMKEAMLKISQKGYQIHTHAIGDAAVRQTLDCIEYAQKNAGRSDYRSAITHLQVVSEQDKARFGDLGIIAITQPYWFLKEPDWYDTVDELVLGPERAWNEYPMKSLIDHGALPTASGDYPVSSVNNPFWAIECGITRNLENAEYYDVADITDMNDTTWLLNPAERVSAKTMIEAYTINGAYQMFEEDQIGSLKSGKRADFIILDKDPMKINPLEIDSIKVLETYKDGKKVYENK